MKYSTLFEYIVENIDNRYKKQISEGKVDVEYERNFNSIPRDIFDSIVLMDPKTQIANDEIKNIGFGCKQLLLPKYMSGEINFLDKGEEIKSALNNYYPNIAKYPKFPEFRSVADFLTFMRDPENASIDKAEQESKLDKIYRQYYSNIDREIFNQIIAMDPQTNIEDSKIGEVAKNLLLVKYAGGETDFLNQPESVKNAVQKFYKKGHIYPDGKDNIQNFDSVAEFITYKPTSPTAAAVAGQGIIEGRDFELIASSEEYDVFKPLTWAGSKALGHARGATNGWCTIGGSDGRTWIDSDGIGTYYKLYQPNGGKHTQVYQFLSKKHPALRTYNYNLAINVNDSKVYEFRDGDNINGAGGFGDEGAKVLLQVLLSDPELAYELIKCSEPLLRRCPTVHRAYELASLNDHPLVISSTSDFAKLFADSAYLTAIRSTVRELTIESIDKIPYGSFAQFAALETLNLGNGLKTISAQAFKNCLNLKTLILPDSLEYIGPEAFAGCVKLKGSVRIPDSVNEIGERGFADTHCKLKVNKNRTSKLKMSKKDMEWIKTHVQSIDV